MMTNFTRRSFSLAALAAPLSVGLPTLANGQSGANTSALPSLFDASLGSYRITSILDGTAPLTKELFSGPDQSDIDAVLAANGIGGDLLPAPVNTYLLQSQDRTILIDTGMGELSMMGPGFGRLATGLEAIGVGSEDIDTVILTHVHPDHFGGLLKGGGAAFANAELVISDVEHGFWGDPAKAASAPDQVKGIFQGAAAIFDAYADRLRPVASGTEVAPGIRLELSPGHTPGHSIVHIDGGERELLMVADTLHNTVLHTAYPDIAFGFDTDTALAAQSRRKLFDRASSDGTLIAATHVHFPGFGRFTKTGDVYSYVPATWL